MNSTSTTSAAKLQALQGGGSTGELIRTFDWSQTPLGAISTWPHSLQSALGICINSNFPIAIYWGPELTLIYNDAWSPIPGNKHPWALGKPAREVWPDIWADIESQFQLAFTGKPGGSKDALLPMQRHGYKEECYFDFTFTPIYGDSGRVDGIFNAVIETTFRVISERRSNVLQSLDRGIASAETADSVFDIASRLLDDAAVDVPFHFMYVKDDNGEINLKSQGAFTGSVKKSWPFYDRADSSVRIIDNISPHLSEKPGGPWPEKPSRACIVPLVAMDGRTIGFLVLGVSARLEFNKEYQSFFESLAAIISRQLVTISSLVEERKRAKALAEIDKAKTAFFSNISHEFRTPLTLMLSPLESVLASADYLQEQHRNDLQISLRNTLRLQKLVNTLLDFSRIEAGKMKAKFQAVDIGLLTEDIASSFRSAIESSGIEYKVDTRRVKSTLAVDIDLWEKIVLNLISNAFKYTTSGKIEVSIEEKGKEVFFRVTDTGIGIAAADIPRIFERFYRVDSSEGRIQEGTGIGLSLVKELVSLHGGHIQVESEQGKGSTFTVILPLNSQHPISETTTAQLTPGQSRRAFVEEVAAWNEGPDAVTQPAPLNGDQARPRVLLADDNRDMREYVERLLTAHFDVHSVSNGEDAWKSAIQWMPDLIISDVMMPRLDGFELLKALRGNLVTKNIPIIFLSARAGEEARVEGIQAGADDYLVKPFSARELLARVQNHILINRVRRATEKEFYNLFLQSPVHIYLMKGPDHVLEFFHPLGRPFVGGRDLTGMKIRDAIPELEGQGYFEMLDQVYKEGKSFYVPESKASFPGADGKLQDFYFNITYLPWRDIHGKIQGVLQFTFDVTEQAKTNLMIRESEERFRLLATSIPQIIWIAEPTGSIAYLSDQWERYTGLSTEEGITRFSSLIHADDVGEVRQKWFSALAEREPWKAEFRLRDVRTDQYTWFSGYTLPLKDGKGNVLKWIGSASDISLQKQQNEVLSSLVSERTAELRAANVELQRSNEDLQQFAHVTSHDLKEPVRKIKMYSDLLKNNYLDLFDEKGKSYVRKIENSTNRIYAMIEGVLQYSSVDTAETGFEKIDLNDICATILEDLELVIAEKKAEVTFSGLPVVTGSYTLIYQLLYNLINNSLKFVRDGVRPVIGISSRKAKRDELQKAGISAPDREYYRIDVADNGIGFEQSYAEKIFDSFIRLNSKDKFEGTGLGLALCKKIAGRHKGRILAHGVPGRGATFSIFLPADH